MRTSYSYFSGGCGADLGLEAAGYTSMGGVEYDAQIAAVAAQNGHKLTVADVRTVDPAALLTTAPDWFHASPVCKSFSQAKTDGKELQSDIEMAQATARFIRYWLPPVVSIENVWQYRDSASFKCITDCLIECGYSYEYWHLNSADYGVPQTRRRLILVARRGAWRIQRPEPTHTEGGDMFTPAWIGWHEAIADLIPTLPASQFAPWQLERLPEQLKETTLLWGIDQNARDVTERPYAQPSPTVTTNTLRRPSSSPIAFILDGQANDAGASSPMRHDDEPMYTLTASMDRRPARAFLVESKNTNQQYGDGLREAHEPATTVITDHKPSHQPKAWLQSGRVVSMTPRALARFQSFPDSYLLPEKAGLACTVIGNAVCPLLMQRVAESVVQ